MEATDWLLVSVVLVGFANWRATVDAGGFAEQMAFAGLGLAAFVVLLDLLGDE